MKKFDLLFRGVEVLMAFFLAVMIFLVFANVVLRYLFSTGFAWSEEVARLQLHPHPVEFDMYYSC